jgi:cellulose synthase/poly-beta-1,6-N-acetylglucosamine synthase-like glycosyltransferase
MHFYLFVIYAISVSRIRDCTIEGEPLSKLEDLNLDVRKSSKDMEERYHSGDVSRRYFLNETLSPFFFNVFFLILKSKIFVILDIFLKLGNFKSLLLVQWVHSVD